MTSDEAMNQHYRFIDLFAGIGGLRLAFQELGCECVFSSDWDEDAQTMYEANFGDKPAGDITEIDAISVPDHDLLLAGFPCQAFSIMGHMRGFGDTRGTLFFDIVRILAAKNPRAVLLENVKQLVGHDNGRTLQVILAQLRSLGYYPRWRVLNALDFGLPHKRERVYIVGFREDYDFRFPTHGGERQTLSDILEESVPPEYYASQYIQRKRKARHTASCLPSVWHENRAGHISSYPFCCALRASASYNYLLVNGERRLTPREMLRLLGFPDSYRVVCSYSKMRKLTGNSVCVPVVRAVAAQMLKCLNGEASLSEGERQRSFEQLPIPEFSNC